MRFGWWLWWSAFGMGCGEPKVEVVEFGDAKALFFTRSPGSGKDAQLEAAPATIDDGCLRVGQELVVWWPRHRADIEDVITAVQNGDTPTLTTGGGYAGWPDDDERRQLIGDECGSDTSPWLSSNELDVDG